MVWRATAAEAKEPGGAARKNAMRSRIQAGTPVGLLGYVENEPVAWCSIAPRSTYRKLVSDALSDDGIWSLACFFIKRSLHGTGISEQLIKAAIAHARAHGAKIVEAYPVDPDSPSYRFMGFLPVFERAGFIEIGREGTQACHADPNSGVRTLTLMSSDY